jgi:hypothetical protein
MKNTQLKSVVFILLAALMLTVCKGKSEAQTGGGKAVNSAEDLKKYLDSQPANSADKPIKVKMSVNDLMLESVVEALNSAGKYVSLDLTGSPLTEIPEFAFDECETLAGIIIPKGVTSIGRYAFQDCTSLTSVTIPDSVISIRERAFIGCTSLARITIPNSVTSIGEGAFWGCKSLTSVTFEGNLTSITSKGTVDVTVLVNAFPNDSYGDLWRKYLAGGIGTYTTTAPVNKDSTWTKQ